MIRVLFVDDDSHVLDNLRHLLHRQEREWDMVFAPDPDAGLAELAREPADVVVSDMRMPGIGGAGFLARVRDLYPGAARIVLSGDGDVPRQALPLAHQYLGKPCRSDQLVDAVNRTASLYTHLDDPVLREMITGLDRLPTVPKVYLEITRLASEPDATLDQLTATVERDPALVAKILQMGNSAWFGRRRITSVREAVQRRERYADVRRRATAERRPFHEAEYDAFGATHAGVGAYLLGMWGLPFQIVEATAYHHSPRRVAAGERRVLAAVHLADVLISTVEPDRDDHTPEQRLDIGFLDACGIRPDLPRWSQLAREETRATA